jgi:tRNA modification GTPase
MKSDTIAAISTGMTQAGIGIVRVSGPEAIPVVSRIFKGRKSLEDALSYTLSHGMIEKDGVSYDEVVVSVFRAPHSYTGEDTVEINCHGGLFVTRKILSLVVSEGTRLAEPGEFTKRAFLNGRMDLSKAESVMTVISSGNDFALRAGVAGLKGKIETEIRAIRNVLLDEISRIEAALDDPEHYDLTGYGETLDRITGEIETKMEDLLRRSENGSILREGIRTAIAGRPNAGKSSLLNLLSGFEKSIVTEIPGTTRDIVEETVRLGELTLLLMDTAGIRETLDPVEKIGVDRARNAVSEADLVLYLVDGTAGKTAEDEENLDALPPEKTVILDNKSDALDEETRQRILETGGLLFSCKTEEGLKTLEQIVTDRFLAGEISFNETVILTSERQIALLREALEEVREVRNGIRDGVSEEFLSADLLSAYTSLGKIIGEAVGDDVADRIFEKFGMGK